MGGGFKVPMRDNPRLSQADILKGKVNSSTASTPKKAPAKKRKREKKEFKQVSLLLTPEQYEQVALMAEEEERSMTYIVKKFLENKGFFNA